MKLTLLCNAGLAVETKDAMLLVDVPNRDDSGFYGLPEEQWQAILNRQPPYDKVCGFWFTHDHPDHFDRSRMEAYFARWPKTPVFLPMETTTSGSARIGPFRIEYSRLNHAPLPVVPPHVVSWITAEGTSLYVTGDAKPDPEAHRAFLRGRQADAAVWNAMYPSRPETRTLMQQAAKRNFIYHMPAERPDAAGMWRKMERNLERYPDELKTVTVWEKYPTEALL